MAVLLMIAVAFVGCRETPEPVDNVPASPDITGTYEAHISKKELKSQPLPPTLGGTWTITFGDGTYVLEATEAFRVTEITRVAGNLVFIEATPAPIGAFNCFDGGERLLDEGTASAAYDFQLEGGELMLIAREGDEPCPFRELLLERTWTEKEV